MHAGIRHEGGPARSQIEALAVLRGDTTIRLLGLHGLQPHVPAHRLWRPGERVRQADPRRDRLGRVGRTTGGDHRARRLRADQPPDPPESREVQGGAGQVRHPVRRKRRDHQRPRAAAPRRESFLAGAGGQRRSPVGQRHRLPLGSGRRDQGPGRLAHAGSGSAIEAGRPDPVRRRGPGAAVLLLPRDRARRHPRRRHPHRLERRGRV